MTENMTSPSPEANFRPTEAADYLAVRFGVRFSVATLHKWRSVGGGPRFGKFGRAVFYRMDDLDAWARGRIILADTAAEARGCVE